MKKFSVLIALLTVGMLMSCKKDYTCECTTKSTTTFNNGQGTTTTTSSDPVVDKEEYKEVKKSNLPLSCKDNSSINSTSNTTGNVTTTTKNETETTCTIK